MSGSPTVVIAVVRTVVRPRCDTAPRFLLPGDAALTIGCIKEVRVTSWLAGGGRRNRPRHLAKSGWPMVAVMLSPFLASLRMPTPEITSTTPRMISQIPTTSANVTIESNG